MRFIKIKNFLTFKPKSAFAMFSIPNPLSGSINTTQDLFDRIITLLYFIAAPIIIIMIMISGGLFLLSKGDPGKITTAKNILLYALIGFAIILIGRGLISYNDYPPNANIIPINSINPSPIYLIPKPLKQ